MSLFKFNETMKIIKKPPNERTREEKASLSGQLEKVAFFSNKYKEIFEAKKAKSMEPPKMSAFLRDIGDSLRHESFQPGQLVFHNMDYGDKLYIILQGEANVYISKGLEELAKSEQIAKRILSENSAAKIRRKGSTEGAGMQGFESIPDCIQSALFESGMMTKTNVAILSKWPLFAKAVSQDELMLFGIGRLKQYYEDGVFKYKKIASLERGAVFGELALLQQAPRAATIVAKSQLEVATLSRDKFKEVFSSALEHDREKEKFFEKMFPGIQKRTLSKVWPSDRLIFKKKTVRLQFRNEKMRDEPSGFQSKGKGHSHLSDLFWRD